MCGADRGSGPLGYCRTGSDYPVSHICLHGGEEPVLTGPVGICNIFFSHCNLRCVYCQNYQISVNSSPSPAMPLDEIVGKVLSLLDMGAKCVGFVSPSHVVPQMIEIIEAIESTGRKPVYVMNTNSYDRKETLERLDGLIDVYLADFKYGDDVIALEYSGAGDYREKGVRALREMYRQKGATIAVDNEGIIESGLIIRHLVLPNNVENSISCLRIIAEEISTSVHVSLMSQYHPVPGVMNHPKLYRPITAEEYNEVVEEFDRLGFRNGWVQDVGGESCYTPDFTCEDPFSRNLE